MAERISKFEQELADLQRRKLQLMLAEKEESEEGAGKLADEIMDIIKKQKSLEDRIDKERERRKKIDNIGIPMILLGVVIFVIAAIVTVIKWIGSGAFPAVAGGIACVGLALSVLTIVVMKILNPDMKLF